jgi:hypothetical protein
VPTRAGELERRQVDDGEQRLLGAHLLAGTTWRLPTMPAIGRDQRGFAHADLRAGELRLRRLELSRAPRRASPATTAARSAR